VCVCVCVCVCVFFITAILSALLLGLEEQRLAKR